MNAKSVAILTLVLCLCLVNWSIYKKEQLIEHGRVVYLQLAPVDPRSLMQGDYMALRFEMANQITASLRALDAPGNKLGETNHDGYAVVSLDDDQVGRFKRVHNQQTLNADEILMQYRLRNHTVKFATNAFFFQEGHAAHYEKARYGGFRVANNGELLLVGLHDENLVNLAPEWTLGTGGNNDD